MVSMTFQNKKKNRINICWSKVGPLRTRFPRLFSCARDRDAKVVSYIVGNGEDVHWGPIFRRNLREEEENELFIYPFKHTKPGADHNGRPRS